MVKKISWLFFLLSLISMLTACSGSVAEEELLPEKKKPEAVPESVSDTDPQAPGAPAARTETKDNAGAQEMQQYLRQVTVQIKGSKYQGSGVIWAVEENVLVIATASHVTEDNNPLTVQFGQGDPLEARLCCVSDRVDAAFLEVSLEELHSKEIIWQTARLDKESSDRLEAGEPLLIMGSIEESADRTYSGSVTDPWIYLEDFENYMLLGQAYAIPGVSGGGVFTQDGILVGILCGGNDADEIAVLPWSVMEAAYGSADRDNKDNGSS
ncbi:MAG: serine protease [Acetatifactor sp.]|nr:serine protease [Acetatifactor sp.]